MNKIYKSIDNIKLNDTTKEKMYNNILKQANNKKSIFSFNKVLRFAAIVIAICIFSVGSVYAMAKIFNWDNKFLGFLGIDQEEAEKHNLENSEVNKSIKIDDMNITIKQVTLFDNTMYLLLDVKFDNPKEPLDIENKDDIPEVLCGIKITKLDKEYYGNFQYVEVNQEKTDVVVVASIDVENNIKKGDNIKIGFLTNYVETEKEDDSAIGYCKDEQSLDWTVDITGNNEKLVYEFEETYYLKNNDDIKTHPIKITITPIKIKLELAMETDLELSDISDDNLRFDENINIKFNDGNTIKLNSIDENGKHAQGTGVLGYDESQENLNTKYMTVVWDNLFSFHNFSKLGVSIIDVNNIKNIQIGDKIFEITK